MADEIRYCEDCRWFRQKTTWRGRRKGPAKCGHPKSLQPNRVTGISYTSLVFRDAVKTGEAEYCNVVRVSPCGPEGKLWEPRENGQ